MVLDLRLAAGHSFVDSPIAAALLGSLALLTALLVPLTALLALSALALLLTTLLVSHPLRLLTALGLVLLAVVTGLTAVLEVRLPDRVGLETALLALLGLAALASLGLAALALLPAHLLAIALPALLTAHLLSVPLTPLIALLTASLLSALGPSLLSILLASHLLATLLTARLLPTLLLAALLSLPAWGLRLIAASPARFGAVLEVRVVAHVRFELTSGMALSLAAGLFVAAVLLVLADSFASLSLLTALFVSSRSALGRLSSSLPALLSTRLLAALLPALLTLHLRTLLIGLAASRLLRPLAALLAARLIASLTAHLLATLLTALWRSSALTLLIGPTLLAAHLLGLGLLAALWVALLAIVAGLAAELEIRLLNRVGLEAALLSTLLVSSALALLGLSALALL
ncbi:hypothetical protein [Haloterrigena salinisoli]|uniref:hypothetical protein n=1 Tax=Haloterrigena salinisoli TaxID=3132747 RepID=UPI0030D60B70